ncbi:hypothetical protein EG878_14570 [Enterococcus faecalis]|nr:hypothetical protein EG878_14570 [Enterococcus faecalis]
MATKQFNATWMGQYRSDTNAYIGSGSPIRVGEPYGYNSYLGFDYNAIREAINTSSTTATLSFHWYVTDGGEFSFGSHKETYNKASGTMPFYKYIGLSPIVATGWRSQSLPTSFRTDLLSNGYTGLVLYGSTSSAYGTATGAVSSSTRPYIRVTGTWNEPPNAPVITYPTTRVTVDTGITLQWTPKGDPDGDSVTYDIAYRQGTGGYNYLYGVYGTGSSYYFNTSSWAEGTSASFAIRAKDPSGEVSDWVYSVNFTIAHNQAPAAPTLKSPVGGSIQDRTGIIRLSWTHNDDDAQSARRIAWRIKGQTGYNYIPSSGYANTTNQYYDVPANTFPNNEIEWTVSTRDSGALDSPYAPVATFFAGEPTDAPTILKPSTSVNVPTIIAEWSSGLGQTAWEVRLETTGGTLLWSSTANNTQKAVQVGYTLANATSYNLKIRVLKASDGLWSPYATRTITTSFTPPDTPVVVNPPNVFESDGSIEISWTNPDVSATDTLYASLFRREFGTEDWTLVATDLQPTSWYRDLAVGSNVMYEYKVRFHGNNGTESDSAIVQGIVSFMHAFLHMADDTSRFFLIALDDAREEDLAIDSELMQFQGRRLPVREYGVNELRRLSISWTVDLESELQDLKLMVRERKTMLYRDAAGRRYFVTTDGIKIKDRQISGFDVTMELTESDFYEGVE